MKRTLKWLLIGIPVAFALWLAGSYATVAGIEEAKYSVIAQKTGYEIRRYEPALIAQTAMPTMSREDTGQAFRAIAGYIFGGNERQDKIAMTSPVIMDAKSEKIAMTAPVVMGRDLGGAGMMAFVLPAKYKTLEDLPKPKDPRVTLRLLDGRTVAALRFSWYATQSRVTEKSAELKTVIARDGLKALSEPYLASYDPPFSIPMLKRHDILIDIQSP
jgi:SOUL heme-binding protein